MNTLVTGGSGFLGRALATALKARGDTVRVLCRRQDSALERLGIVSIPGDLRDPEACLRACTGAEVVFHTAARTGVWGPRREFFGINVEGTANLVEACRRAGVACLVYTSSPSVIIGSRDIEGGDESLPYPPHYLAAYPESKAAAERLVLAANGTGCLAENRRPAVAPALRTCALRPHLIWGPGDPHLVPRIVRAARAGRLPRIGLGNNRVDITFIDNAVQAHLLAAADLAGPARCAGKAYFVGDAEPVRLWDWIGGLLGRLGLPPIRRALPLRLAYGLAFGLEVAHRACPALGEPLLTRFTVCQLARSHWFSHRRAAEDFGYRPPVGPDEGLERLTVWARAALA